jgi:hypothetical protein
MENVAERLLNPGVLASVIGAGVAYGVLFLWSLNIRPNINLFLTAVAPGAVFLAMIWSIRAMQGVASTTYVALLVDWFLFAIAAFVSVLVVRRWRARA